MKKGGERLQLAIDNLADLFISGHIQAAADPVGFLDRVVEEIVSLRAKFDTMHLRVTPQQKEIKELKKEVDDLQRKTGAIHKVRENEKLYYERSISAYKGQVTVLKNKLKGA